MPKGTIVVDPADGKVPFQPWAAAKRQWLSDNYTDPPERRHLDPDSRCLPASVPRINYVTPYNEYRILQKPGAVVIFAEWNHSARVIPTSQCASGSGRIWNLTRLPGSSGPPSTCQAASAP